MKPIRPLFLAAALLSPACPCAGAGPDAEPDLAVVHRIKQEAIANSKVMEHVFELTDVNGPRVTNSPGFRRAAEWCVRRLKEYGLQNAHTETWDFGRGWSCSRFSIHLIEPAYAPLAGFALAWTPGTDGPVRGEPVLAVIKEEKDFEKFAGKLKGRFVLLDEPRPVKLSEEPIGRRYSPRDLAERAAAPEPAPARPERDNQAQEAFTRKLYEFLVKEEALATLRIGYKGEAGLVAGTRGGPFKTGWPVPPPSAVLTPEHYNRIARLLEKRVPVRLELEVAARFHDEDLTSVNVVADLPGTTRKDQIVLVGGHLDSWHGGTGAVDNAAGVAVAIEAVRVLKALGLDLPRTVRVGLWGGEEQGFLGSKAYVKDHLADPEDMRLKPEHARLSAYFNLDNGSGRIRGVYLQGNDMLRPLFEAWLRPFADLGAETVTIRDTRGTDHLPFDAVGVPAFQFMQDPLEYDRRTHHSNADLYDHVRPGDLMQASAVMASFLYHTAVREELLPRKPLPAPKRPAAPR
jgi:hypothetical protein